MKKLIFRILAVIMAACILLCGCANSPAKNKTALNVNISNASSSKKFLSSSLISTSSANNKNTVSSKASDWIYYVNRKFSDPKKGTICKLYRAHSDGSKAAQVADVETENFVVSGDWIYYDDWERTGIYKIHTDGTDKTKLNSLSGIVNATSKPEGVYYGYLYLFYRSKKDPSTGDPGGYIYRMKLDGTGLQKICNDIVYLGFQISNGYIYYSSGDNYSLYRIRTDGTEKMKVTSDSTGNSLSIAGNTIYYVKYNNIDLSPYGSIYKMNLDGTRKTALGIDNVSFVKVFDGSIYYSTKVGLFKANLYGKGRTKVNSKGWVAIQILGSELY